MPNYSLPVTIIFALNAIWFGAAFKFFSINPQRAARLLVPAKVDALNPPPLLPTLTASLRFLGGMNLALAVFAILLLLNQADFPHHRQVALFAAVFAVAHASQFAYNVPIALQNYRGNADLWWVLKGRMLVIFTVDFLLMVANTAIAIHLLASA
jgi:hypothetical protein